MSYVLITILSKHPYLWHYQASRNRTAILEYAENNYPRARIVEEYYPSAEFNPTNKSYDSIQFELDGIKFFINARDGKVDERGDDGYSAAVIQKEIREKYLDNYFLPKGLDYNARINFSDCWPQKNDTLASYKGNIWLEFESTYDESKLQAQNYDWFYDFYCYWKDICPTPGFTLWFYYWTNPQAKYSIYCDSSSEFDSKETFFSASKKLPINIISPEQA